MIISRNLGHKEEIPGSGQWRVITADLPGYNECWVCDRTIYSLIFWNQLIGTVELRKFTKADEDFFISKIKEASADGARLDKM